MKQVLKMVASNFSCRNLFSQTPYQLKLFEVASKIAAENLSDFSYIKNGDPEPSKIEKKSIFNTSSPNGQGKLSHLSCFEISYNLPGMSSMS